MNFSSIALFRQASGVPTAVLHICLILILAWIAHAVAQKLLRTLRDYTSRYADSAEQGKRIETLSRVTRHVSTMVIVALTGMLILGVLGISIAPILGAAGVVGIAVGFAAQNLLKDYFNGFFLLLENQLRLGDAVEVGGKSGIVEEITLRFVRLRSDEGTIHFVPNSLISVLSNRSLSPVNLFVDIGVAAGSDMATVTRVLEQACRALGEDPELAKLLSEPARVLGIQSVAGQAVQMRVLIKSRLADQARLKRAFLALMIEQVNGAGIRLADQLPWPQQPPTATRG